MLREVLFAKIHQAVITQCEPEYMGSITIDPILLEATGLAVNEKVLVADCENGNRLETYIFRGERGSGEICMNGAAAHLVEVGHRVLIMSFCHIPVEEMANHRPRVVICNSDNTIGEMLSYDPDGAVPLEQ